MANKGSANTGRKARASPPPRGPGAAPLHLTSVDIVGTRIFEHLAFEVPAAPSLDRGQWIVVLGENGTGKTTLLRCLSLQIMPVPRPPHVERWFEDGRAPGYRRTSGTGLMVPGTLIGWRGPLADPSPDVEPDGFGPERDGFAYGSTRGTALGGAERDVPLDETLGIETLFSPGARLIHAETWLRREALRASTDERARRFLKAVLVTLASLLPGGERILIVGDQIQIASPSGSKLPLAAMSDGYLATLGWTIDLIARWAHRYRESGMLGGNFAHDMPCVVLVDDLDLHLHPRWQLQIIPRLRKAFPKTTFVVTTHNPLTLQGALPGEVFVLQRDEAGKVSISQRDVPPGADANHLFTGEWFGLNSTLDEGTLLLLDEHRQMLLAGSTEADPARKALEAELRRRLNGFADTSIERLAHGVVAELLDERARARRDITPEDRARVVAEVRARLAAMDTPATGAAATSARERPKPYKARTRTSARTSGHPVAKATKPAKRR